MKHLKKLLFLIIILFPSLGKADEAPIQMHNFLFNTGLIAKAKIVSYTDHYYNLKILDVYRDDQTGAKVGDTIKIMNELNVIKSVQCVRRRTIEDGLTGVAFLGKSEERWGIGKFPLFLKERVTIRFGYEYCRISGNSAEIKTQIQEYFREFKMTNGKLIGQKTAKEVLKSNLGQLVLTQYSRLYMGHNKWKTYNKIRKKIHCGSEEYLLQD
ncbi:MAG: hypothetical protein GQ574_10970 [Crocinitomix sp.]|nr:hypothetical protein [Crocinitomix sp.]